MKCLDSMYGLDLGFDCNAALEYVPSLSCLHSC